jgi:fatty acid desaturase
MNPERLASYLVKRSDLTSALVVVSHVAVVLAPLYFAASFDLGLYSAAAWLWVGAGMNGLLNLFHECAHLHVFNARWGSVVLGRWVLGPLALADFDGYQRRHWVHHRRLGEADDPKYIYRMDVRGWRFLRFTLRCLLLGEALKKFSGQVRDRLDRDETTETAGPSGAWLLRTVLAQSLLAGSLVLTAWASRPDSPWSGARSALVAYGFVYLYGLASLTVWLSSLRAIAEHQITADRSLTVKDAALRNFSPGFLTGRLLGSYGFVDHATHHDEPAIPYYRLRQATAELASANPAFAPLHTYEAVLAAAIR